MKLTVVSPTFNESENVQPLIDRLADSLQGLDYEVLIVDDDSPDLTWQRVEEISRECPRIRLLRRTHNRGLSAAVIDGFSDARGDLVVCIDADLQHDSRILPKMVEELERGSEIVVGSRYMPGGGTRQWSLFRRFESWVATRLARHVLGVKLSDPMSGYFALRRDSFMRVRDRLSPQGFKILLEIVMHLRPAVISELPYTFSPRTAGDSKLTNKVVVQYLGQLWRLSKLERVLPLRFVQFSIVGGIGVVVNLVALGLIVHFSGHRDWRASALASTVATANNYILNNLWTFRDRVRTGRSFYSGYLIYLTTCLLGVAVTTFSFAGFVEAWERTTHSTHNALRMPILLLFQLAAILLSTIVNYFLNNALTWRKPARTIRKGT